MKKWIKVDSHYNYDRGYLIEAFKLKDEEKAGGMHLYEDLGLGRIEITPFERLSNGHLRYESISAIIVRTSDYDLLNKIWYNVNKFNLDFETIKRIIGNNE